MAGLKRPVNERKVRCLRCPEGALESPGYRIGRVYRSRGRPRPGGVSGRERGARSPACAAGQKAMRNPTFTKWSSRDLSPKRPE